MSRRTKLTITAVFLVLLAIPAVYLIHAWHPANPLRFRQVWGISAKDPFGTEVAHRLTMEARNTSDVTVMFVGGTFREREGPDSGVDILVAYSEGDGVEYAVPIPSGGTINVDFDGVSTASPRAIMDLHPGKWQPRQGSINYRWLSRSRSQLMRALDWIHERVPVSWQQVLPMPSPFVDTTDIEPAPKLQPDPPAGDTR